jgi:hypothetical protein
MARLRDAGFTFVRLPVDPALLTDGATRDALVAAVRRLHRARLAVVVSLHPVGWRLETEAGDRARLLAAWRGLAPALRPLDPALLVPEILNEPVFPGDPAGWAALQRAALRVVRAALPRSTVLLTGHDWGSVAGLLALTPDPDPNVAYSFHLYDPAELTSLAAYRPGLDRAAVARLRFPAGEGPACRATAARARDAATRDLMLFYCTLRWDEARVAERLEAAAAWARRHDAVVLAGEFGASAMLNPSARLAWLRTVRARCEAHGIGWALWGYDDVMGFDVPRPPNAAPLLDPGVLRALGLRSLP